MKLAQHTAEEDERLEAASAWVVRLHSSIEPSDLEAFDAWLGANPANVPAYDRALSIWRAYGEQAPEVLAALEAGSRVRAPRRVGWIYGAGLAAAAAAAGIFVALPHRPAAQSERLLSTAVGERRSERLADGTRIDLNAASKIAVVLAKDERRVRMDQGEAVFDVAHDANRPFVITAGDRQVRVVGTQFDVRRRGDSLSVTVSRGLVEVRPTTGASGHGYRLSPGQRLDHRDGEAAVLLSSARPEEVLGWRAGRLAFHDQPLSDVLDELNRQFPQQIRLEDPALGARRVSGVLVLDNAESVARRIALLAPVAPLTSGDAILLRSEARVRQ